jgi:hypothetical protein
LTPRELLRTFDLTGWLIVLGLLAAILLLGRCAWDASRALEAERDRAEGLETAAQAHGSAATERAVQTRTITETLEQRNRDAEQTPDSPPDARDLRRRCRQLCEAGDCDEPTCRGFAG